MIESFRRESVVLFMILAWCYQFIHNNWRDIRRSFHIDSKAKIPQYQHQYLFGLALQNLTLV